MKILTALLLVAGCCVVASCDSTQSVLNDATKKTIKEAGAATGGVWIIHANVASCPSGWDVSLDYFTEDDGSKQTACILMKGYSVTGVHDYLLPGESFIMGFPSNWPGETRKGDK